MANRKHRLKKLPSGLTISIGLLVALALVIGVIAVYAHHHKNSGDAITVQQHDNRQASNKQALKLGDTQSSTTSSPANSKTASNPPAASVSVIVPTGNFVSNHSPHLNGTGYPPSDSNQEQSRCNTTPGISCVISFTQGSTTKSLPAQTTDATGATYWSWSLQQYGITQGNWKISATASSSGQTQTATDATELNVQP